MTLLLAFFIIMQAFADVQGDGLFYSGQGSFIRAIETFGLGGIWEHRRGNLTGGSDSPRYPSAGGPETPGALRRIDVEREEAQMALAGLQDRYATRKRDRGRQWSVVFCALTSYPAGQDDVGKGEDQTLAEFAERLGRVMPVLLAQGCLVRVGADIYCTAEQESDRTRLALAALANVERRLLDAMSPALRRQAAGRFYTFCRRRPPEARPTAIGADELRVDIMLTRYPGNDRSTEQ